MQLTRRIIVAAVCVVIIVVAAVISYDPQIAVIRKGDGVNAEINTLDEVNDVVRSIEYLAGRNSDSGILASAASDARYASVTVTETTDAYSESRTSYSADNVSSDSSSSSSMRRKLQIAFTQNAVFYNSAGQVVSKSTSSRSENHTYRDPNNNYEESYYWTHTSRQSHTLMDFEFSMYISYGMVYIKFDRLEFSSYSRYVKTDDHDESNNEESTDYGASEVMSTLAKHTGEWINCSSQPDLVSGFIDINDNNTDTLSELGDYIDTAVEEEGALSVSGNIYSLTSAGFDFIFGFGSDDDYSGEFYIDLTNAQSPYVSIDYRIDRNNSDNGNRSSAYSSVNDLINFENINNTEIVFDDTVKTVDVSEIFGETV